MATHYRAGEITYRQIKLTIYEITAITYTDPRNTGADRPEIDINFGDNSSASVARINGSGEIVNTDPNNIIKKNILNRFVKNKQYSKKGRRINL